MKTTCFVLLSICSLLSAEGDKITYRLATGNKDGIYHQLGIAIRDAVNANAVDFKLELVPSGGSKDNIKRLEDMSVHLGFAQSDQIYPLRLDENSSIQGIASLYTSAVHILVSRNISIEELDDMRGRTICLGEKNSGTHLTGKRILSTFSIYHNDFTTDHRPFSGLEKFFRPETNNRTQFTRAAFVTVGLHAPVVVNLIDKKFVRLIPIPKNKIRELLDDHPYYVPTKIERGTYSDQNSEIQTIGVREMLVCRRNLPAEVTEQILEYSLADENVRELASSLGSDLNALDISERGMSIDLHKGAKSYYFFRRLWASFLGRWIGSVLIFACVFVFWIYVYRKHTRLTKFIRRNSYPRLLVVFISIFILVTILIYWNERDRTLGFQSLLQSFWSTTLYVLNGMGDNEPQTTPGKTGALILLLISLATLGLLVGRFAAKYILQTQYAMPKNIQNHIVICNWNNRGDRIVRELHAESVLTETDIVVISDQKVDDKKLRENSQHYERVFFITSDPKLHDVLRSARAQEARTVVILATPDSSDPDAHSALIALAIRNLCKKFGRDDLRLVAETANHRKIPHLKDAGVDTVICPSDYGMGVLAQSVIHKKIPEIYDRLLSYSGDTNEIYIVPPEKLSPSFIGKSFREICKTLLNSRIHPVIPIGICRKDETLIINPPYNPVTDKGTIFEEGDSLVAIAFERPDIHDAQE